MLSDYCVSHKVTRSEAAKRALEHLFDRSGAPSGAYEASAGFRGSDKTAGDVARHPKRLLRQRLRHRTSLG